MTRHTFSNRALQFMSAASMLALSVATGCTEYVDNVLFDVTVTNVDGKPVAEQTATMHLTWVEKSYKMEGESLPFQINPFGEGTAEGTLGYKTSPDDVKILDAFVNTQEGRAYLIKSTLKVDYDEEHDLLNVSGAFRIPEASEARVDVDSEFRYALLKNYLKRKTGVGSASAISSRMPSKPASSSPFFKPTSGKKVERAS